MKFLRVRNITNHELKSSFNLMLNSINLYIANEEKFTLGQEVTRQSLDKFKQHDI